MSELKPCPFCGHVGLGFVEGSTFRWLAYTCEGCCIGGETRVQTMGDGTPEQWAEQAKADAIEAWNTRSTPKQGESPQQVEPGWVRTSEHMPAEGQFVYAAMHEWNEPNAPLTVAHGFYQQGEWLSAEDSRGTLYTPEFWMPAPPTHRLPPAPKEPKP